jgi:1-acyl-sn-glycerol-3-phosphate acyltransferase
MTRWTFFSYLGGIQVIGRPNIPKRGPVLIACNHLSELDPPAVGCAARRHLRFFAKEELFKGAFGKLIASIGAFPVRRGASDMEAIRKTLDFLETGQAVLLFPEGTRGDGKQLGPMGRGAALLGKRSGAWIVPAAINGTQWMLPRGAKKLQRGKIKVAFGKPFRYSDVGDDREAFITKLEEEIRALSATIGLPLLPSNDTPNQTD